MPEFRIEGEALRREAVFSRLSWGTVFALATLTVSLVVVRCLGHRLSAGLIWLLGVSFFGAFFGSCILGFREALSADERQMVFVLDERGITRIRHGYPPISIAFTEVSYLGEELKWLIVKSSVPQRKIGVSRDVKGYELIRAELLKHLSLSPKAHLPISTAALSAAAILSWAALVWFHDLRIVIPAGVVAISLLAFGSHRLWMVLGPRMK